MIHVTVQIDKAKSYNIWGHFKMQHRMKVIFALSKTSYVIKSHVLPPFRDMVMFSFRFAFLNVITPEIEI